MFKRILAFLLCFVLLFGAVSVSFVTSAAESTLALICDENVNVRKGASTSYDVIETASYRIADVLDKVTSGSDVWYKLKYNNGTKDITGYVFYKYVKVVSYTKDASFETKIKDFPESYKESLRRLHVFYPNWEFVADKLSISFSNALKLQYKADGMRKQVSYSSQPVSWRSMGLGAYDWKMGQWIQSNGGWTGASKEVIAYYMDPRNFFGTSEIFMFLQQGYDKNVQTESGVKKIIKGTFMENNYSDSADKKYSGSYAKVIMEAAKQSGVSPYILASKIRQEIGVKETDMVSGKTSYGKYFNFFNIGASGSTPSAVLKNGLARAKSEKWTTRSAAIIGGAKFLSDGYISAGQDTYYYQDFNVVNPTDIWHQYAQAVHDARSKGVLASKNYLSQTSSPLSFKIPVFTSINATPYKRPAESGKKNNYYFDYINAEGLTPSYKMYENTYSLSVSGSNATISIKPVKGASYVGEKSFSLKKGTNKVYLKVKAETGYSNTYTVNVIAERDCLLKVDEEHCYVAEVTPPTCTQKGYTTYKCEYCGKYYVSDYVNATGHKFGDWRIMTEKDSGYQVNTEIRTCSLCRTNEYRKIIPYGLEYSIKDGKTTVTDYKGDWTKLTIPDEINEAPVVKIADSAFSGCTKLTQITVPESVTSIGANAFSGCTALTTVNIGFKVSSIGKSAFSNCSKLTVKVDSKNSYAQTYLKNNSVKNTSYETKVGSISSMKVSLHSYEPTGYDDIKLSWQPVFAADGYCVYYKKYGAASYTKRNNTTNTYYDFIDLQDNTGYEFKVIAFMKNTGTNTYTYKYSAEKTVTGYTTVNLSRPTNLKATLYGHNDVKLSWSKVSNATHYRVYYKKADVANYTYLATTDNLYVSKADLADASKYQFRVYPCVRINDDYYIDPDFKEGSFYTTYDLKAPKVKAELYGYDDVKLSWNKVDKAEKYMIYYRKSTASKYSLLGSTSNLSFKKADLADGAKYYFMIYPCIKVNGEYFKDPSYGSANITTAYNLSSPKNVKSELYGLDDVKVSWNKVNNATHYKVYYKKSGSSRYKLFTTTSKLYAKIPNLADNAKYYIRVFPCTKANGEYLSDPDYGSVTVKTSYNLSPPKTAKAKLFAYDGVSFSWSRVSKATHYKVYYKRSTAKSYTYLTTTTKLYTNKSDLADGVKYTFKVAPCIKIGGKVVPDNSYKTASIYTLKRVSTPTVSKYDSSNVTLKWNDISGESGYQISRATSKSGTNPLVTTNKDSVVLYAVRGTTFYYKVRAYKTVNGQKIYAPWSNVKSYKIS